MGGGSCKCKAVYAFPLVWLSSWLEDTSVRCSPERAVIE